jgi:hypothetical protein
MPAEINYRFVSILAKALSGKVLTDEERAYFEEELKQRCQ